MKRFFLFDASASWPILVGNFLLALLLLAPICLIIFHGQAYQMHVIGDYRTVFVRGWLTTIAISATCFILSSIVGILAALARRSRILVLRFLARIYIELFRGTPLLVQILFFFYVIAHSVGLDNRYAAGILTLSLFNGAYLAEIFRAGIQSVGASQLESAKAIGLTPSQSYRFVILPQAFRLTLPPLAGQFASLIKDSSLLSIIGISEFTYAAQQVNSATYSTLESFIPLAIGYLILTLPISLWSRYLEKRYTHAT